MLIIPTIFTTTTARPLRRFPPLWFPTIAKIIFPPQQLLGFEGVTCLGTSYYIGTFITSSCSLHVDNIISCNRSLCPRLNIFYLGIRKLQFLFKELYNFSSFVGTRPYKGLHYILIEQSTSHSKPSLPCSYLSSPDLITVALLCRTATHRHVPFPFHCHGPGGCTSSQ